MSYRRVLGVAFNCERQRAPRALWLTSALLMVSACGVDDRKLALPLFVSSAIGTTGASGASGNDGGGASGSAGSGGRAHSSGGSGGAPVVTGGSPATGGAAGQGPSGGAAGAPELPPLRCPDLNENQVADCDEPTLAQNSAFNQNLGGWLADPDITQEWAGTDANRFATSGSIQLTFTRFSDTSDGLIGAATSQCLSVMGGSRYDVAVQAFIKSGQAEAQAGLVVVWFSEDVCASQVSAVSSYKPFTNSWTTLTADSTAPATAKSALIRLMAVKPWKQASVQVCFDNLLFVKR